MNRTEPRREAIETLTELISDMPVAMLTTCCSDGSLHSRPMINVNAKFDGDLWFFTHKDDPKVKEIQKNPQVAVSFSEPSHRRYVSISGSAELVRNPKHAEILWTRDCEQWFPNGLQDPTLALLRINIQRAEYWDQTSNAMRAIVGLFKTQARDVENEKIDWEQGSPASSGRT